MVGVREVASLAGVSPGTVSNYLNYPDKVAPDTGARIQSAIKKLGYVGNSAARILRVGESKTIAHLAFEVGNPFFFDFAKGVEDRAAEAGYSMLIANSAASEERQNGYLDLFEAQRVRGLLLSPVGKVRQRIIRLGERGIPTVLIDQQADTRICSSVSVDDVEGGRLAASHLIEIGRRRLVFVGGPLTLQPIADRLKGARAAVEQHPGVEIDVIDVAERTIGTGKRVGQALRGRGRENLPDGIFAANDLLAIGILHGLLEDPSIRVPDDVALIGYDDIDFAANAVIPLSSVQRPGELFGRTALDLLHQEIRSEGAARHDSVIFQPKLIVRRSSDGTIG